MEERVETPRESRPLPRLFGAPDRDSTNDVRINRANRWISLAPHVAYGALSARLSLNVADDASLAETFVDAVLAGDTGTVGTMLGMAFADEFTVVSLGRCRVHLHFAHSDQCGDFVRRYVAGGAA